MEKEIWKDIPQYEGYYQVSNLGRVRGLDRVVSGRWGTHSLKGKVMRLSSDGRYLIITLRKLNKKRMFSVHSLVAMAFLGHVPNVRSGLVVDHIDEDKTNNSVNNLQVVTHRVNLSRRGGSSEYVGVSWHKTKKKWGSSIRIDGKGKHLGYFENEIEASEAYQNYLKNNL